MASTTNFNWSTPDDTSLVKDGAAAIRTLGQSIDTSMAELKGGTTGQVLSKTSNTDMDFTWVAQDDSNAIQNAIVDAKGDLIAATAADTPARLAVGTNGQVLTADSSAATGLAWATPSAAATSLGYAAGKNKIINGDFGIWQRGTSFSNPSDGSMTTDRFRIIYNGTGATRTLSQQTFTPGAAPVAGYEAQYFLRTNVSAAGTGNTYNFIDSPIEDVRTFANQTTTLSFWAKADTTRTISAEFYQNFGSGGSGEVYVASQSVSLTTSWQRFTLTFSIPSISGKTLGSGNSIRLRFGLPSNTTFTVDLWGVQWEAGSTATAFQTATGTIQGELVACQRYYQRFTAATAFYRFAIGQNISSTQAGYVIPLKVTMRTTPTFSASTNSWSNVEGTSDRGTVAPTLSSDGNSPDSCFLNAVISSANTGYAMQLRSRSDTTTFLDFSAEL